MKVTVLGSGGWIPNDERETCSYLVEMDNNLIILDAGTGISRLKDYLEILEKYSTVNIILSHYHLDHIVGLSFLPLWLSKHKINIWAPGKKFYKDGTTSILTDFTSFPYFSRPIHEFSNDVNVHEYDEVGFNINDTLVKITTQKHSAPSFGITLGDFLHYATDTEVLKETFVIAGNVKILLHECWDLKQSKSNHSSLEQIIELSTTCKDTKIGLIHINPSWTDLDFKGVEALIEKNIFIVTDKMIID